MLEAGSKQTARIHTRDLVGKRVEIPVHYDMWMRGARFGTVTSVGKDCAFVRVKLDMLPHKRLKVWRIDLPYIKVL